MADLRAILAQLLGQQEEPAPNLTPRAPATQANTRGIFGRRPVGPPAIGYGDLAPMRPDWAETNNFRAMPQEARAAHPFPFPMAGEPMQPSLLSPAPQAARVRVPNPESPGAYSNFADYANAQLSLRTPAAPVDREPWRQNRDIPETARFRPLAVGEAPQRRGLEPPSAPQRQEPAPFSMEDEAWRAAVQRARGQIFNEGADPTGLRGAADRELAPLRARAGFDRSIADLAARPTVKTANPPRSRG